MFDHDHDTPGVTPAILLCLDEIFSGAGGVYLVIDWVPINTHMEIRHIDPILVCHVLGSTRPKTIA